MRKQPGWRAAGAHNPSAPQTELQPKGVTLTLHYYCCCFIFSPTWSTDPTIAAVTHAHAHAVVYIYTHNAPATRPHRGKQSQRARGFFTLVGHACAKKNPTRKRTALVRLRPGETDARAVGSLGSPAISAARVRSESLARACVGPSSSPAFSRPPPASVFSAVSKPSSATRGGRRKRCCGKSIASPAALFY